MPECLRPNQSAKSSFFLADFLVAEWIHFTLFGIVLPTIKLKVYTFWGLRTQQVRTSKSIP